MSEPNYKLEKRVDRLISVSLLLRNFHIGLMSIWKGKLSKLLRTFSTNSSFSVSELVYLIKKGGPNPPRPNLDPAEGVELNSALVSAIHSPLIFRMTLANSKINIEVRYLVFMKTETLFFNNYSGCLDDYYIYNSKVMQKYYMCIKLYLKLNFCKNKFWNGLNLSNCSQNNYQCTPPGPLTIKFFWRY